MVYACLVRHHVSAKCCIEFVSFKCVVAYPPLHNRACFIAGVLCLKTRAGLQSPPTRGRLVLIYIHRHELYAHTLATRLARPRAQIIIYLKSSSIAESQIIICSAHVQSATTTTTTRALPLESMWYVYALKPLNVRAHIELRRINDLHIMQDAECI